MLTGLWAVLALVSAGAGLAAVLSVQSSVGQTAVRPLSQEDVERAVATGSSGGSDIALDAVDGLASPVTKPSASLTLEESANDDGGDLAVAPTDRSQEPPVSADASSSRTTGASDSTEPSHDSSTSSRPTSDESTTTESAPNHSQSESESESSGKGSGKSGSNGSDGSSSGSSSQGSAPSPRSGAATPTAEPQD